MSAAHTIARLKPQIERITTPQCCVEVHLNPAVPETYYRHRRRRAEPKGYDIRLCSHSSAYEIDGAHYCARHAGMIALQILMAGGTAKRVGAA